MDDPDVLMNWDELQKDYATTYFGGGDDGQGDQFAGLLADNLRGFFKETTVFGNYRMTLEDKDKGTSTTTTPTKKVINSEFYASFLFLLGRQHQRFP